MNTIYCDECFYEDCRCEKCSQCNQYFPPSELYEYRGAVACEKCFDEVKKITENARQNEIEFQRQITEKYKDLDFGNSSVGKANREIFGLSKKRAK